MDVHDHKTKWDYSKIRCKYFHSHILLRKDIVNHEENECDFKTTQWIGCNSTYWKGTLKAHITKWKDYPIQCERWEEKIKRCEFSAHKYM